MSGICGWIGRIEQPSAPEETLRRMVSGLPHYGTLQLKSVADDAFGLAIHGHPKMCALHADADVCAAIEGYPVWTDNRWAELAKQADHATALARG